MQKAASENCLKKEEQQKRQGTSTESPNKCLAEGTLGSDGGAVHLLQQSGTLTMTINSKTPSTTPTDINHSLSTFEECIQFCQLL